MQKHLALGLPSWGPRLAGLGIVLSTSTAIGSALASIVSAGTAVGIPIDFDDPAYLWQDMGQTPVTTPGDPIGLILPYADGFSVRDVGGERVFTGLGPDIAPAAADWFTGAGWTQSGEAFAASGANATVQTEAPVAGAIGDYHVVKVSITGVTQGRVRIFVGGSSIASPWVDADGDYTFVLGYTAGDAKLYISGSNDFTGTVSVPAIQKLPVTPIIVPALGDKRPTWAIRPQGGKRNTLTQSVNFQTNWTTLSATLVNDTQANPLGVADTVGLLTSSAAEGYGQVIKGTPNTDNTQSIWVRSVSGAPVGGQIDFAGIAIQTFTATSEWQRVHTSANVLTTTPRVRVRITNSGEAIYIWGPQLEAGLELSPYQKVTDIYTVTEAGKRSWGWAVTDGGDDAMETAAPIDPNGSDEITVVACVRKETETGSVIVETSVDAPSNDGTFRLFSAPSADITGFMAGSRGTQDAVAVGGGYPTPVATVLTGIGDVDGDGSTLRVNGAEVSTNTNNQGNGPYQSHKLHLFGRGGTSLFFKGEMQCGLIYFDHFTPAYQPEVERLIGQSLEMTIPDYVAPTDGYSDDMSSDTSGNYTVSAGGSLTYVTGAENYLEMTVAEAWEYFSTPAISLDPGKTYTVTVDFENPNGTASADVAVGTEPSDALYENIGVSAARAGARQRVQATVTGINGTTYPEIYVSPRARGGSAGFNFFIYSITVTEES